MPFHHALGALGPFVAAFLVSALDAGRAGALDLVRRMGFWRHRIGWLLFALLGPLVMFGLAVLGMWIVGGHRPSLAGFGVSREFPQFLPLAFFAYNVLTFGYGEEVGWRGFALPRLQARHGALVSTLLLTIGWAIWHIPLFFYRPGYLTMGAAGIAGWFFSLLTGAVLLTWLFNESHGSILVVALFHATVDIAFTSEMSTPFVVNAAGSVITIFGIAVLIFAGPRYLSRSGMVMRSRDKERVIEFMGRDGVIRPNDG
ncbi:MAG: CPBP family intramembrane glutamic endopeptidase [Fibrobacteria bacterium]